MIVIVIVLQKFNIFLVKVIILCCIYSTKGLSSHVHVYIRSISPWVAL